MFDDLEAAVLYKQWWAAAVSALRSVKCPSEDIKDVYQDAFLISFLAHKEGRISGDAEFYVRGVCKKIWQRLLETRRVKQGNLEATDYLLTSSSDADVLSSSICREMRQNFQTQMQHVWTPQQNVIMLLHLKHFKNPEIAEQLNIQTTVVANSVADSRKRLQNFIEQNATWKDYLKAYLNDCFNK